MHIDIPHHTACSYPTCNLGERGLEAGWQGGKKERVRLEWTQDAGRAQWTDKMTYNQLPTERERHTEPMKGKYTRPVYMYVYTHRNKGGKGRLFFELWTPLGHRDGRLPTFAALPLTLSRLQSPRFGSH